MHTLRLASSEQHYSRRTWRGKARRMSCRSCLSNIELNRPRCTPAHRAQDLCTASGWHASNHGVIMRENKDDASHAYAGGPSTKSLAVPIDLEPAKCVGNPALLVRSPPQATVREVRVSPPSTCQGFHHLVNQPRMFRSLRVGNWGTGSHTLSKLHRSNDAIQAWRYQSSTERRSDSEASVT